MVDAVVIGLGAMVGAGVFAAIGPAAAEAGAGMLVGLAIAAVVAYANATSSAQLAAAMPLAGGTYAYGRERLGPLWGFVAGWGFVIGKTASLTAMALTFGSYVAPDIARPVGIAAVVAMTTVNYLGIRKTAAVTTAIAVVVLATLAGVVAVALLGDAASVERLTPLADRGVLGILGSAGLLFFAFAGYARIATLGEEVVDPARTIPRAIPLALGIVLVVYAAVAVSALAVLGPGGLAGSRAPLVDVVRAAGAGGLAPVVRVGAAVASLGVLLSLLAGVSRTAFAMARDRELPGALEAVHPVHRVPHRAELLVGAVVVAVVLVADLRDAIGFSSFAVLTYYAIANASAWTQPPHQRRWPRWLQAVGVVGCATLAFTLPAGSVIAGVVVLAIGVVGRSIVRRLLGGERPDGRPGRR